MSAAILGIDFFEAPRIDSVQRRKSESDSLVAVPWILTNAARQQRIEERAIRHAREQVAVIYQFDGAANFDPHRATDRLIEHLPQAPARAAEDPTEPIPRLLVSRPDARRSARETNSRRRMGAEVDTRVSQLAMWHDDRQSAICTREINHVFHRWGKSSPELEGIARSKDDSSKAPEGSAIRGIVFAMLLSAPVWIALAIWLWA